MADYTGVPPTPLEQTRVFEVPDTRRMPVFDGAEPVPVGGPPPVPDGGVGLPAGMDCTMMMPVAGAPPAEVLSQVAAVRDELRAAGVLGGGAPVPPSWPPRLDVDVTVVAGRRARPAFLKAVPDGAVPGGVVRVADGVDRAVVKVAGPASASLADVDEARRIRAGGDGGDPPIYRQLGGNPVLVVQGTEFPWDGVGPDLVPIVNLVGLARSMPDGDPPSDPVSQLLAGLVRSLAGDVEALVAEVRVRRAAGPGGDAGARPGGEG